MQLYSFYDNKEFLKDYGKIGTTIKYLDAEDWWTKYGPEKDIETYSSWLRVGRFFDGVGILLERDMIERDLLYPLLGDLIQGTWEGNSEDTGVGNWLDGTRYAYDRPNLWRHFENLYNDYIEWVKDNPV